jgi:hypothetical protein
MNLKVSDEMDGKMAFIESPKRTINARLVISKYFECEG